ncbi:MAG TPA: thiamine diphosphokinase [Acholeplasmataceae bacterium]|nr:thiamine diphosphokinase [Acholeplasmataceae bacterium]
MIIKVVCSGFNEFKDLYKPDENEMLVGVDGGIYEILRLDKKIDLAVGDFDSCNIEEVVMHCNKIRVFPKEKDYGDLELAIMEIKDLDFERIEIYNATGGRLDHYQAILNVLAKYSDLNIWVINKQNRIRVISENFRVEKSDYDYVSFFAIDDGVRITLKGFKYELNNYLLNKYENLGLSNEILENYGEIELNNKRLFLFETK